MPLMFETATAEGNAFEYLWNQAIITPSGYGIIELTAQETDPTEKGLSLTELLNAFLQKSHSITTIRGFFSSPVLQDAQTCIVIIPLHESVLVALKGAGSLWLVRRGKAVPLLQRPGVLKGRLQCGDMLVAVTGTVTIPEEKLKGSFVNLETVKELAATIAVLFQTYQSSGKMLFLHAKDSIKETVSVPVHKKQTSIVIQPLHAVSFYSQMLVRNPKKRIQFLAVVVGMLFLFSVVAGIQKQQHDTQTIQLETSYHKAEGLFTEAIPLLERRREESIEKLQQAKAIVDPLLVQSLPTSKTARDLKELQTKIEDNLRIALRIYTVTVSEYFDASLLRENRVIDQITRSGDTVFFLDSASGFLGGIALPTKNADVVTTSTVFVGAQYLSGDRDVVYVLNDKNLYYVTPQQTEPLQITLNLQGVGTKDWFTAYANNLYILDKQQRQLWRFIGSEARTFSAAQQYFGEGQAPDLTGITSLVIDGSVWMGTTFGKVYKYTQGAPDAFLPRGLDTELGNTLFVYTSELTNKLYVLDTQKQRVVVFTKEGLYQGQYRWNEQITPSGIVVSEQQNRVILLADKKLYSFTLQ